MTDLNQLTRFVFRFGTKPPLFACHARHEAEVKNDRGNLPLHSAASFRAPLEVAGKPTMVTFLINKRHSQIFLDLFANWQRRSWMHTLRRLP
jgi:hypothetical protein